MPSRHGNGLAIEICVAALGVGMALGPVVGGVMTGEVGWRAVFFVNLPFGALVVLAALRGVRESRDTARGTTSTSPAPWP
jgi:MFS family permease